ncbi:hypothetical protein FS749_001098 [Ceratobasidium sp. UAMH 11750]|nr:hypothetical protein FS749_001098 [Ceratobasidium sp. UAMH 11750]
MEDRPHLPYIDRLIKEVLRWRPPLPSGVPHACYQDDMYKGYLIPKNAIVIGNIWAMSHDPEVYEDPETFEPDRFLDPNVPTPPTFRFGRRICAGIHYAEASLYICIMSILSVFSIKRAKDNQGNDIIPVPENGKNAAVYHSLPFKFTPAPRSSEHEHLV